MAIKSDTGKLFLLLDKCLPDNQFIEKTLLIEKIREMQEYRELRLYAPAGKIFKTLLEEERLKEAEIETLKKLYVAIPYIVPAISAIINSIHSGDVSLITEESRPDFCDADSLKKTIENYSNTSELENFTNIEDDEFLDIFNSSTIKTLSDYANTLSASEISDIYNVIQRKYSGKKYCIPAKEIKDLKKELISLLPQLVEKNKKLKKSIKGFFILKAIYTVLSGLLFFVLIKTNMFYGIGAIMYGFVSFMPLVLLLILG